MPSISKIRFTHVLYEGGNKRYNDEVFLFDGHNGAIVLENGGGKTVFIQTALQAMLPHTELAGRKLRDTLLLENGPAHVAIEWILNDKPRRRYAVTCISLFLNVSGVDSFRYAYEYGEHDAHGLEHIPFVKEYMGKNRPADKGEIQDYYSSMTQRFPLTARTFGTIKEYKAHLEESYHIIASEWDAVAKINSTEGGIENFFDECKSTSQLFDRLLIPTVEETMEGFEQGSFANLFESHREGFKRYKELKEQIEENKLILQELGQYVRLYEGLHGAEELYDEARAEAKAYQELTAVQHEGQKNEQAGLEERLQLWMKENDKLQLQLKSLELAETEQEQSMLEAGLAQLQLEADTLQQRLRQAEHSFYSLKYAGHRSSREEAEARLAQADQQLARLEQGEDEAQLQERWEHNCGELRSVFAGQERDISEQLKAQAAELTSLTSEKTTAEHAIDGLRREIRTWELTQQNKQTQLEEKTAQQQRIAREILANPALEKVPEQMPIWSVRQQELDEQRIEFMRQMRQMSEEKSAIRERQRIVEDEIRKAEREQARDEQQRKQLHEEQALLIRELALLRPNWERLTTVYDQASSISARLLEGVQKRQEQKAAILQKERLVYRYVDDYHEQEVFFADPEVERLAKSWGRQYSLLQTGTEYIRSLNLDDEARGRGEDSLWSVTLVTTDSDKKQLLQKLTAAGNEFAYPIRVLGTSEAAAMVRGIAGGGLEQWAVPLHFKSNETDSVFREWKAGLLERAGRTRQEREKREDELALWQSMEQRFQQFVHKYPLVAMQTLEQQLQSGRERLVHYTEEYKRSEQRLIQLEAAMDKIRIEMSDMQDIIHQLGEWLKDGQRYITLEVEKEGLDKALAPVKAQVASLEKQLGVKQYGLARALEEYRTLEQDRNDTSTQLQLLLKDDLYEKVQSFPYTDSSRSIAELKEEHGVLEYERAGIMKERRQLEIELKHEQEKVSMADKAMKELLREQPGIDPQMNMPVELEARKQALWQQIEGGRSERDRSADQLDKQQARLQHIKGRVTLMQQQFSIQFPEQTPARFEGSLEQVKLQLQQENARLQRENKELKKRSDAVEQQLRELDGVLQLWDKHTLLYKLNDERLQPAKLEERVVMDFVYARLEFSERAIRGLQTSQQRMDKERIRVSRGRDSFKSFCNVRVKDVKLRQMATEGVEHKDSYAEVTEFRQTMEMRIQKAIHIMEETIQTHDRDLQEFIQRIHTHLKHIVQELKELPKKTRIKTADGWREIYSFSIPEWEDQDGKDRIRSHIEWILSQLERSQYMDGQGRTQQGDVRKNLEKWLDARQLLQVVLKSEAMKVTCRKVMNDHQVTKASYSWEQSNRWSGGEKWSKNMTLFLGLLNYVAERRQYIKANMKLHRTVILDNPFGKASSEHVLSPVFFIAEQLGFQIIALTAHAEGKFLQDYFPIVYSCRLRSTADSTKQIIEPAKQIQHAYFRDHAPETLERIDSRVDQLGLF
ncbi:chromosome segregation ATPase [Paenibacillus sp. MMS20-IR301]|uniref:chromosome segregation ATPase n=1 Tax=Paenibacillus sp. MMS20-IR301 TaxID=2895946 RepID=UPI0028EDDE8D|nr:chromosome segregation ATPase [Paenibacillus sp. MMS20-IR301]WNS40846.1 chromosome segregation ATPase [Paenibacillus sp. MMS20-IR301]